MTVLNTSAEREPLLQPSTSPALSNREGKDDEQAISTSRGALIVGSVGLLIFLQGMSSKISALRHNRIPSSIMYNSIYA